MRNSDGVVGASFNNGKYNNSVPGDKRQVLNLVPAVFGMGEPWSSANRIGVVFERGYGAQMMAIDGTWRRPCIIEDISDTGAKLGVDSSIPLHQPQPP